MKNRNFAGLLLAADCFACRLACSVGCNEGKADPQGRSAAAGNR